MYVGIYVDTIICPRFRKYGLAKLLFATTVFSAVRNLRTPVSELKLDKTLSGVDRDACSASRFGNLILCSRNGHFYSTNRSKIWFQLKIAHFGLCGVKWQ